MTDWRDMSITQLRRAPLATVEAAYLALTGQEGRAITTLPPTKAAMIKEIEAINRGKILKKARRSASLCTITAREVDEWLRSLPPKEIE